MTGVTNMVRKMHKTKFGARSLKKVCMVLIKHKSKEIIVKVVDSIICFAGLKEIKMNFRRNCDTPKFIALFNEYMLSNFIFFFYLISLKSILINIVPSEFTFLTLSTH